MASTTTTTRRPAPTPLGEDAGTWAWAVGMTTLVTMTTRPPTPSMSRTLSLIDKWGVYNYAPDHDYGTDLPLVAVLDDDDRTILPVRDVRGLLSRGLLEEIRVDEDIVGLGTSVEGRRLLMSEADA